MDALRPGRRRNKNPEQLARGFKKNISQTVGAAQVAFTSIFFAGFGASVASFSDHQSQKIQVPIF